MEFAFGRNLPLNGICLQMEFAFGQNLHLNGICLEMEFFSDEIYLEQFNTLWNQALYTISRNIDQMKASLIHQFKVDTFGSTRVLAHATGQRYVSLDNKPVSRVSVTVVGEASFKRTRHQLGSHTPNVFIWNFQNVTLFFFGLVPRYVLFDPTPVSRVSVSVDGELSFPANQTSIRVTHSKCFY